mmetsp:Transcript_56578/g.100859  ORF Transcript_56578/g.100859 Transcript_56578/m.100859 type:complete len:80 (+) Transcript_56578:2326-2565(+)
MHIGCPAGIHGPCPEPTASVMVIASPSGSGGFQLGCERGGDMTRLEGTASPCPRFLMILSPAIASIAAVQIARKVQTVV